MTQYLSDSPSLSLQTKQAVSPSFVWLDDPEMFEVMDAHPDDFQALLTDLKREILPHDINPLIGAATFLFIRIFQLEHMRYRVDIEPLQQELITKIKCFTHYAREIGCSPNLVLAARYVLCAWIDEYLENSPLGKQKAWIQEGLLSFFRFDIAKDHFFLVLKKCLDDAQANIDLLELIYLCLSFGFKGPYRYPSEGQSFENQPFENQQKDLAIIVDHLYHKIRSVRGEFSKSLCQGEPGGIRILFKQSLSMKRLFLFPFLLSVVASVIFMFINHQLGEKLKPLFYKLSHLVA